MNHRPKTSGRPPTGPAYRPITAAVGRPLFGAADGVSRPPSNSRMTSARPPSRANLVTAQGRGITAQIAVVDRPMTQQGLGGLKTAVQRNQRQVQDKSYFQGLLRTKITEVTAEIGKLVREIDQLSKEQSTYLTYDNRAKTLAQELRDLQGTLGDYNMLVDKLNTDTETEEVRRECQELKAQNEQESRMVDLIFAERREKEAHIKQLEREIEQEKRMAEKMVASMKSDSQEKYFKLKKTNSELQKQMESLQEELNIVNSKKVALEDEIAMSEIKQEAVGLHEKIRELEDKKESLLEEERIRGTPAQEQERLLKQVKDDNQELATMERQTNEMLEKITKCKEELQQVEQDLEENQSERSQKYRELKKRDETMTQFLESFDEAKAAEIERKTQSETSIVEVLENISRNLTHFHHLPTPQDLASLKEDLAFKEGEMEKSKTTASSLIQEQHKVNLDLQKIEQLEEKIKHEMEVLEKKISTMEEEMVTYTNIDKLKDSAEEKRRNLTEQRNQLTKKREFIKQTLIELQEEYDSLRTQLNENETHSQLCNLERKWQHVEQTNFAMKEFIASKLAETDYKPIAKVVSRHINDYHQLLHEKISEAMLKR